jgi:hypothetical protein
LSFITVYNDIRNGDRRWLLESRPHFATLNNGEDLVPGEAKRVNGSGWRQKFPGTFPANFALAKTSLIL